MFVFGFLKEWKNDFFKILNCFLPVGPMNFHECHVKITSKFGRHLLAPVKISYTSKKSPTADTANVAIIWRLSSIPLTGTFLVPLMLAVYFPGEM